MVVGGHYLDETEAAALVTIPIAAADLAAYLEATLTMLDARINIFCGLASNSTVPAEKAALYGVELTAFIKAMKNTRLTREGNPAEVTYMDTYFSIEDHLVMARIRDAQNDGGVDVVPFYKPKEAIYRW